MFRFTALRGEHDAGIVPENMEAVIVAEEGLGAAFDGCEIIEVKVQEEERACGYGDTRFDARDGSGGLSFRARRYVDFGVAPIKNLRERGADAARRAGDNEDLVLVSANRYQKEDAMAHFAR